MRKLFETADPSNIINFLRKRKKEKKGASNQKYKSINQNLTYKLIHTYLVVQTLNRNADFTR